MQSITLYPFLLQLPNFRLFPRGEPAIKSRSMKPMPVYRAQVSWQAGH